jgi:glucan phosphoethanolaminetransferase (alkaline phosphatase superfamily)
MINLCAPAIIYLIFSVTQILIDIIKGLYNTALMKGVVTFMVTILLNILCERGLSVVSWIIVFIPFILMTVIVSMLLYIFGLDAASGTLNNKYNSSITKCSDGITIDSLGNIIVYDPEYNQSNSRPYYQSPNIIIPNPHNNDTNSTSQIITNKPLIPYGSSSPAYQS